MVKVNTENTKLLETLVIIFIYFLKWYNNNFGIC